LEQGVITMEGDAKQIAKNPKIHEAYLGVQK
jgi:ABC-type branched-subunit amino acid transport system ATPase component